MAVKHVTIHECDLCAAHVDPKHFVKVTIGIVRYDTCPKCSQHIRSRIVELEVAARAQEPSK